MTFPEPSQRMTVQQAMDLAMRHAQAGQIDRALSIYQQIVAAEPGTGEAWNDLGILLIHKKQLRDAIFAFGRASVLLPQLPHTLSNLGNALRLDHQLDEAIAVLTRAVALHPDFASAHMNFGASLFAAGRFEQAIAHFERAIQLQPDFAQAHHNLGMVLLLQGNSARGLVEHEWRLEADAQIVELRRRITQPRWDGSDPAGKRILIYCEQGLGDTIQFCRYVPLLAARSARVILRCQPELMDLMKTLQGVDRLISRDEPLPEFDLHAALLSLPLLCGSAPMTVPYLRAHPEKTEFWKRRLTASGGSRKVGLAWVGNRNHENDRNRSLSPGDLSPLARASGVTLVSLQKGVDAEGASALPAGLNLLDWTNELHDFSDTAGLIDALDLVITVDTAVAHLAGALGKPVWLLLPFVPDWRWMLDRTDTPWYPAMRLFRQPTRRDWGTPLNQLVQSLLTFPG